MESGTTNRIIGSGRDTATRLVAAFCDLPQDGGARHSSRVAHRTHIPRPRAAPARGDRGSGGSAAQGRLSPAELEAGDLRARSAARSADRKSAAGERPGSAHGGLPADGRTEHPERTTASEQRPAHAQDSPGGTPARDLREAHARVVSKPRPNFGVIANLYAGDGEPNGDDKRLIHRYGGDLRIIWNQIKFSSFVKFNDWGPYDYHRDHNLTYPLQVMIDLSTTFGIPQWFELPQTRLGIRYTRRSLDQYSVRYFPDESLDYENPNLDLSGYPEGNEWEIRTYLHFSIGP